MLVYDEARGVYLEDETPGYGKDTLEDFFRCVAWRAGQDC